MMVKLNLFPASLCLGVICHLVCASFALGNIKDKIFDLRTKLPLSLNVFSNGHQTKSIEEPELVSYLPSRTSSSSVGSTEPIEKFGCSFENEDYFVRTGSIFYPVFGDQVDHMKFDSIADFQRVLKGVNAVYSKLLEDLVYTNFPEFYDFYDEYKNNAGNENFIQFYNKFVPKFFPRHGDAAMAVELLDQLVAAYPEMRRSVHLITCSMNAKEFLFDLLRIESSGNMTKAASDVADEEPPIIYFHHDSVAALLRIRIAGRLGYVLMDPGYGMQGPVVVMADGKDPHNHRSRDFSRGTQGEDLAFYLPRRDYIVAKSFQTVKGGINRHEQHLYYIGKPYCSFIMTTTKAHILRSLKVMVRRDATGQVRAAYTFNADSEKPVARMILPKKTASNILNGEKDEGINYGEEVEKIMNFEPFRDMIMKADEISVDDKFLLNMGSLQDFIVEIMRTGSIPL